MITFSDSFNLELSDLQRPYKLIQAARKVAANPALTYLLSHDHVSADGLVKMIAKSAFDAKVAALNPTHSLPVLVTSEQLPITAASIRLIEMYRLILGQTEFPGNLDPQPKYLEQWGFEHKIHQTGRQLANRSESKTAASGHVTASFSIASSGSVTAAKSNGAALTVTGIADIKLGVVALNDGVSPVSNGVVVSLAYQTVQHLVVNLYDSTAKQVIAVLVSKELTDYLEANV